MGVSVWFDREDLKPGERWKSAVIRAIRQCSYFLVILSKTSIDKRGYVQRELKEALEVLDEIPEHQTFIIPVRMEECEPTNPQLRELQYLDLFPSYDDGLGRLKSLLAGSTTASPTVARPVQLGRGFRLRYCQRFGDESRQLLHGVAADCEGNVIIVGDFWGSVDFGGGNLVSAGDRDVFVAKFGRGGEHIWSRRFGDEAEQVGVGVAADDNGGIFLASAFAGGLDVGSKKLVSRGRYNVGLVKLDKHGEHLWSQSFGDQNYHVPECTAVSPSGAIIIAGRFKGTIDFGGGDIISASKQTDIFLAKFSPDGDYMWARRVGGPFEQQTRSLAVDARGNICLAGVFKGELTLDGHILREPRETDYCGFLARFDEAGNVVWLQRSGEPSVEQASVVAFDKADGGMLMAGFIRNRLPDERQRQAGSFSLLVRYDENGLPQWSRTFGPRAFTDTISVAPDGAILLTGHFEGSLDLGLGAMVSEGGYDVFAALLARDGRPLWCSRFGDRRHQFLIGGALLDGESMALAGSFHGTIDFGSGPLVAAGYDETGEGTEDVFFAIFDRW